MVILISAAESSSDAHGAELLRAIRKQLPADVTLDAYGIGGPKLQAAGLRAVVDAKNLLAMGFVEVLGKLPTVFRSLRLVTAAAQAQRPDVIVVLDYPDFHFRLAKRLRHLNVPMIYYIPPKVWAWRKRRIFFLKKYFVKILSILPFEEAFYRENQIPVKYVGNPLVDELPFDLTQSAAREKQGLRSGDRVLVLMPGSRASELKQHLVLMIRSAALGVERLRIQGIMGLQEKLVILLPLPAMASITQLESVTAETAANLDIRVSRNNAAECLVAANAGLIKSGTSTLEAGLLQCPHVIVYRPSKTTAWIFKNLIRYRGPVGLVNLVAGWQPGQPYLVPEILCDEVSEDALATAVVRLLSTSSIDSDWRNQMTQGFVDLRSRVLGREKRLHPSVDAAAEVIATAQSKG